jgi:MSHA biogenesis protein MshO
MNKFIECVGWVRPQAVTRRPAQRPTARDMSRYPWWVTPLARLTHPTPSQRCTGNPQRGFTLVELVMVIALAGAVAVMISSALSRPLEGFVAQSRRAELVDLAAGALNRMARDIRLAVPNSVHVNAAGSAIEMFNVLDAGRYRPNRLGGDGLIFTPGTAAGCTANFVAVPPPGQGDCSAFQALDSAITVAGARWLVVYNIGAEAGGAPVSGSNLWASPVAGAANVISPDGSTFVASAMAGSETRISLAPPGGSFSFAYASPQRRFYLSDQIVGYRCDAAGNQLIRFSRTSRTPTFAGTNAAAEAVQATHVTACSMTYQPGSTQRAGLVTLRLQLTLEGESIELFQQVHVDNAP